MFALHDKHYNFLENETNFSFAVAWLFLLGDFALDVTESAKAQVTKTKQPFKRHTLSLSRHRGTQSCQGTVENNPQNRHHVV